MTSSTKNIRPSVAGTLVFIFSCICSFIATMQELNPSTMAKIVSIILLCGMTASFLLDWRRGLRNLIRLDVFAFLALYFLTLFEFLFNQPRFDLLVIQEDVATAINILLVGFATISIGRHVELLPKSLLDRIGSIKMKDRDFLIIFFAAFFLSFLPMLLAVNFNPVEWFEATLRPRFSRPWGRGRYGDFSSLLYELRLLGYIVPPLGGVILAHRKSYSNFILLLVGLLTLVLVYYGFSSGTRGIFAVQVAGFFAGFFVVQKQLKLKFIIPTLIVVAISFLVLADYMLQFRNMGMGRYFGEGYHRQEYKELEANYFPTSGNSGSQSGYLVDYNLWRISQLVAAFPDVYPYLGSNLPFVAITKPVPRALWPSKPVDLEVGLEEAVGVSGLTVAVTWVGEAYITGGVFSVVIFGFFIGAYCSFWNHLANFIHRPFALLVFASGFYSILLLMRSVMFFTTSLLPSIALVMMGIVLYKNRKE